MNKAGVVVLAGLLVAAGCSAGPPSPAAGGAPGVAPDPGVRFVAPLHDRVVTLEPGASASCAPLRTLTAGEPSGRDRSLPLSVGASGASLRWATPPPPRMTEERRIRVCGIVVSIRDTDEPGNHDVTLGGIEGMTAEDPLPVLSLQLPERIPVPFAPGDAILVDHTRAFVAASAFELIVVSDVDGDLLLSLDGADGARMDVGPVVRRERREGIGWAGRRTHRVDVTIEGLTAQVPPSEWRWLSTPSGEFAITGAATSWSRGRLPQDAGDSSWHSIVRLPPRDASRPGGT